MISTYRRTQKKLIADRMANIPESGHIPLPIEWQEENRYLPPEVSPENYGQFDRNAAPHLIEPINRLHPDDPTTHLSLMKSVQSAGTVTLIEGGMGFATRYKLGSCLFLTSNKGIGRIRSSSALDPLIDNAGLSEMLRPISSRMRRKTADTTYYKEFSGGIKWLVTSYNSIGDMKSNTFAFLFLDEWDEAGVELANQGDISGILEGRTLGVRFYKIVAISTPTAMETSRIYRSFIEGDQRRFFVPCPECGEPQILILKGAKDAYGLTFNRMKDDETGAKILDPPSVRYICQYCGREWFEHSKHDMLVRASAGDGGWRETWKGSGHHPLSPNHKSYHAQGLISPFLPWPRICEKFISTRFGEDLALFKDFTINVMGNPWARVEQSESWETLRDRADDFTLGGPPPGGLRLYAGVDVHGDRLEVMVISVGHGFERWVVDYRIFFGNPADLNDTCWSSLHNFCYSTKYLILGQRIEISRVAIDTGYDPKQKTRREKDWTSKTHTVYAFVGAARQDRFLAIKGTDENKAGDVIRSARVTTPGGLTLRYDVATHVLKDLTIRVIKEMAGPNAIHFPKWQETDGVRRPIDDDFFRQFLSERYQEIRPGEMGWKKIYSRNEKWDTFLYATAAAYADNVNSWDSDAWDAYKAALTAS